MAKFLANENVPSRVVESLRSAGHDVHWVSETTPGASDEAVLNAANAERRVLLTFDKDFGELAFRLGIRSTCGIILLRPRLKSPDYLARFVVDVLAQSIDWEDHFSVAEEGQVRVVPLPP
jgi:predicted nuclease of predicted toxin-antitoxin system